MHIDWPHVTPEAGLVDLLQVMSDGKLGMAVVMAEGRMLGVVSDGDIRRALQKAQAAGIRSNSEPATS